MSYTYHEITDIINSQKPFLERKYGLEKIGIFNFTIEGKGVKTADFLVHFKNPSGMNFIDFAEFIESLVNVDGEFLTEEGLENIKDDSLKSGIKNKTRYV